MMRGAARDRSVGLGALLVVTAALGASAGCRDSIDDDLPDWIVCQTCHGNPGDGRYPTTPEAASNPVSLGPGAHLLHLVDTPFRKALACGDCHVSPRSVGEDGHIDALPAEVTWGELARTGGAAPAWDRLTRSCSDVYCHGATMEGGRPIPAWREGDSVADCGSCHGNPPPAPHPAGGGCQNCHVKTVLSTGAINVEGGQHIDGTLDAPSAACNGCHGSEANPAPPLSTKGLSPPTELEVGAHQEHLGGGTLRGPMPCDECHVLPADVDVPGHLEDDPGDVTWGVLARTGDAAPAWNRADARCADTYCHGATLTGGTNTSPKWTVVDGTQDACGTCHGNPPPSPHPSSTDCRKCHAGTVAADGKIDLAGGKHVNGVVDAPSAGCNGCHGGAENAAPPVGTDGAEATTARSVGAHQAHLRDGALRLAMECSECHVVPTDADDGHADGAPAELAWGPLATARGAKPAWKAGDLRCEGVYCHGATLGGGSLTTPKWIVVDGTQDACGTCHGNPPPAPHPQGGVCRTCHPATVNASGGIDVAGGRHIDGQRDVVIEGCGGCHGVPPDSGTHRVHYAAGAGAPVYGDTSVTSDLLPGGAGYAFGCGNCHPIDPSHHGNGGPAGGGAAEVDLSPAGAPPGSLKAQNDPAAAYAPGALVAASGTALAWTRGTCSGSYCHSRKTVSAPGPIPMPGVDFEPDGPYFSYPPYTVEFGREYATVFWGGAALSCDACHGFPPRTTYPDVVAGAGDSHSWFNEDGTEDLHARNHGFGPLACAVCHYGTVREQGVRYYDLSTNPDGTAVYEPVPIASRATHLNGRADVAFTPEAVQIKKQWYVDGATWSPVDRTCANVSCHRDEVLAVWGNPYRWPNYWECNRCHQK